MSAGGAGGGGAGARACTATPTLIRDIFMPSFSGTLSMYFLRSLSTHSNTRYRRPSECSTSLSLRGQGGRRGGGVLGGRRVSRGARVGGGQARSGEQRKEHGGARCGEVALYALHNVGVVELLEQRDFPQRSGRHALVLNLKADLLERHKVPRGLFPGLVHDTIGACGGGEMQRGGGRAAGRGVRARAREGRGAAVARAGGPSAQRQGPRTLSHGLFNLLVPAAGQCRVAWRGCRAE